MVVTFRVRVVLLVSACALFIGGFYLIVSRVEQPTEYHAFADNRMLLGMPNMLNVVSNLPFVVVGIWGLVFMASSASGRPGLFLEATERWPYWIFFLGLVLTGIGSSYYHYSPTNDTLAWDRAPLAITFMALFSAILGERLQWKLGVWLLGPLVLLGIASVLYWHWTEANKVGDMRFYLLVQFLPLLVLPFLLIFFRPRYTGTGDLAAALACYVVAKVLEDLDRQIYSQGAIVSGHTLKHLVAGLAGLFILSMLWRRQPRSLSPQRHEPAALARDITC